MSARVSPSAQANGCPACHAPTGELAFFDDGSFICQECDFVSGGDAQREVEKILANEAAGIETPLLSAAEWVRRAVTGLFRRHCDVCGNDGLHLGFVDGSLLCIRCRKVSGRGARG